MKVIPLLMGIVTTATIVQPSVAMNPANSSSSPASKQPSSNLYAQIILNIGHSPSWRERERERERERDRERNRGREQWEWRTSSNNSRLNFPHSSPSNTH